MNTTGDINSSISSPYSRISLVCSAIAAGLGILVMIGWITGMPSLASFISDSIPQAPGAALAFILLGSTWFFHVFYASRRSARMYVLASALFVLIIALLNLIRFFTGFDAGIEEFLIRRVLALGPGVYGAEPMSPITAANFVLISTAMILLLTPLHRATGLSSGLASILASIVASVNLVVLLGYLYGTPVLYGEDIRPVSLPSGVTFIFLSTGLIAASGPDHFPLRLLVGPSVRALLLRNFLLVISAFAFTDLILHHLFLRLNISTSLGIVLSVLISLIIVSAIVLKLSRTIGGMMEREEAERKRAEESLCRAYDELEIRVQERTAELAEANEALLTEITERKRAEEELKRSNAELEQFAYIAAHDLQEPLRMISIFTQLLAKRYKGRLDKDADELIIYVVDGAKHMQQMIEDLLTYSRIGTHVKPFEPANFEAVFDQAVANLKAAIEENKAQVTHDPLPTVMADASQMIELFQNLIDNAIKFRRKEPPRVHVSAKRKGNEWIFSVKDNGIGISPEFMGHLFKIFQREYVAKYPGTGVGLAICRRIVERHGGRIWAESEHGKGSIFYFTIPG